MEGETQTNTETQDNKQGLVVDRYAAHDQYLVPVSRFLGIQHLSELPETDQGKINEVVSWIERKGARDSVEILTMLRGIEQQLDPPPIGVSRIDQLYQWVRLELDEQKITQAKQSMMRK